MNKFKAGLFVVLAVLGCAFVYMSMRTLEEVSEMDRPVVVLHAPSTPATSPAPALAPALAPPTQLRISSGPRPGTFYVMWATDQLVKPSLAYVGTQSGRYDGVFRDDDGPKQHVVGSTYTSPYIHKVLLDGLQGPPRTFYYVVGSKEGGFSEEHSFSTAGDGRDGTTLVAYGDPGLTAHSRAVYARIGKVPGPVHALLIAGDLSYADKNTARWDEWGRAPEVEALLASCNMLSSTGNHEAWDVVPWAGFRNRFAFPSPAGVENFYWSTDVGLAHVIGLDSEGAVDWQEGSAQYVWLKQDLADVDRARTPFTIVVVHSPVHSNKAHGYGKGSLSTMYSPFWRLYEPLFLGTGAHTIAITGHVHAYERTHPVARGEVVDPRQTPAMVYFTVGTGGNHYGLASRFIEPQPAMSAFRTGKHYGFSTLRIVNATHCEATFFGDEGSRAIDHVWLTAAPSPR